MSVPYGQFWPELRKRIEAQHKRKVEWVISGKPEDFVKYREAVAYTDALDWVLGQVKDINDDRSQQREEED